MIYTLTSLSYARGKALKNNVHFFEKNQQKNQKIKLKSKEKIKNKKNLVRLFFKSLEVKSMFSN